MEPVESAGRAALEPAAEISDEDLVQRARAGDRLAFELLMRRNNRRVYRAVRSVLHEASEVEGALPLDPPADRKDRKGKFVTVADVADFVVTNMPPGKGGSLPADQYWDILAFDLHANGVDLQQPLTADLAKTLTIPR